MAWQHPASRTTTGITIRLGEIDDLRVAAGVELVSKSDICIYGAGSGHRVEVFGSVSGRYGIYLGNAPETDAGESVRIGRGGEVFGSQYGIVLLASDGNIVNAGTIGSLSVGVYLEAVSATTQTTLLNRGVIDAGRTGINVYSSSLASDPETVEVSNGGLIRCGDYCYDSNGFSVDVIGNTGRMVGELRLGGGDDIYRGRGGTLSGAAYGEDGNDIIHAGQGANVLDGGAGNDRLAGGRGADVLRGGADADRFIFAAVGHSTVSASGRDTVEDFNRTERDRVDLRQIDADAVRSGNQAFEYIGASAFSGDAGELRAVGSGGDTVVRGDVDGDGKADFSILIACISGVRSADFLL